MMKVLINQLFPFFYPLPSLKSKYSPPPVFSYIHRLYYCPNVNDLVSNTQPKTGITTRVIVFPKFSLLKF